MRKQTEKSWKPKQLAGLCSLLLPLLTCSGCAPGQLLAGTAPPPAVNLKVTADNYCKIDRKQKWGLDSPAADRYQAVIHNTRYDCTCTKPRPSYCKNKMS